MRTITQNSLLSSGYLLPCVLCRAHLHVSVLRVCQLRGEGRLWVQLCSHLHTAMQLEGKATLAPVRSKGHPASFLKDGYRQPLLWRPSLERGHPLTIHLPEGAKRYNLCLKTGSLLFKNRHGYKCMLFFLFAEIFYKMLEKIALLDMSFLKVLSLHKEQT